jgi:hypothetical protein
MKSLFLLALGVASLSACKKDSAYTPSQTELLTAKNWRLTAFNSTITVTGSSASTTTGNVYALLSACQRDNFYKFNTDKTLVEDEGAMTCANTPQKTNYTWDFNNDQTKLLVTSAVSTADFGDIVELSATTLRLRNTVVRTANGATTTTLDEMTYTAF